MTDTPSGGKPERPTFIFDTYGDWHATKIGDALYSTRGEYIGYVEGQDVYKRDGEWVGRLSRDGRILRKRTERRRGFHPNPPCRRSPLACPRGRLPPMMAERITARSTCWTRSQIFSAASLTCGRIWITTMDKP